MPHRVLPLLKSPGPRARHSHRVTASLGLAVLLFALTGSGTARPGMRSPVQGAPAPCGSDSSTHLLDFWLGDWRVTDSGGRSVGTNRIESIAGGCAVEEIWHDPDGSETRGFFYYHTVERTWKYVLITPSALSPGGLKERHLIARLPDGTIRFQGEIVGTRARYLDRMTLVPKPGGVIYESVERSSDGGNTWELTFDGFYHRGSGSVP